MLFLSCRAQSRHLLLLEILKMRDSSTPLGMTREENPSVRCCRAFRQQALTFDILRGASALLTAVVRKIPEVGCQRSDVSGQKFWINHRAADEIVPFALSD
jgi:hypothetical protein